MTQETPTAPPGKVILPLTVSRAAVLRELRRYGLDVPRERRRDGSARRNGDGWCFFLGEKHGENMGKMGKTMELCVFFLKNEENYGGNHEN